MRVSNKQVNWFLEHGWALDSTIWADWTQWVPDAVSLHVRDREYFQSVPQSAPPYSAKTVVITHSFGLHRVRPEILTQASLLIIIGGFQGFCMPGDQAAYDSVEAVKKNLESDWKNTLIQFYRNCYHPIEFNETIPKTANPVLFEDLCLLQHSIIDIEILKKIKRIMIIHGSLDQIIDVKHGIQLHERLPNSRLHIIPGAGHMIPVTHARECCELITSHGGIG